MKSKLPKFTFLLALLFTFSVIGQQISHPIQGLSHTSATVKGKFVKSTTQISTSKRIPDWSSSSQHFNSERCGSGVMHQHLLDSDPLYKAQWEHNKKIVERNILRAQNNRAAPPIYTVPVVFHVIHKGEAVGTGTNISDAQIQSAIDALNRDYRRTSDDGGIGQGAGPDSEIQFCLASTDPSGNPTTGINRVSGTGVSNYSSQGIISSNESAVKSLSKWNQADYCNIWVVSEIDDNNADQAGFMGGTLGYAYLPSGFPNTDDGIVAIHVAVGNDPNQSQGYNLWSATLLNRVLSHEMGHYLGLEHVFNDSNPSTCSDGDGLADTPDAKQVTLFNCSNPQASGACTNQDITLYMDYTPENCQNQFSQQQVNLMRGNLASGGLRQGLNNNTTACAPANALDCGISAVVTPNGSVCGTTFTPIVTIKNIGSTTLTSATITYDIDGTGSQTFNWTGSLTTNQTENVVLSSMTTTSGSHTFNAATSSPNGGTDEDPSSDALSVSFTVGSNEIIITVVQDQYGTETSWTLKDSGGNTLASGGPYADLGASGTQTHVDTVCVVDGCFDWEILDSYGDGMCCAYGNGSWTLTEAASGGTLASGGTFTDSETANVCVPATPGPPNADFSGAPQQVVLGNAVNFTDLSSGNPPVNSWNWDFGDGMGTAITQNPSYTYTAIGLYTVSLSVGNGQGSDSITKVDYIEVIDSTGQTPGGCNIVNSTTNITGCLPLMWMDGQYYYVDPVDSSNFTFNTTDNDQLTVSPTLAGAGITSEWQIYQEIDGNGDTNLYFGATSWFDTPAQADNWIHFGQVTLPPGGAELAWYHKFADNGYRDGYEVMINTVGSSISDFQSSGTVLRTYADNDTCTEGDTLWAYQQLNLDGGTYGGQTVNIAFHHNANDMFLLFLDEMAIVTCDTAAQVNCSGFTASVQGTDDACNQNVGSATATPAGGISAYSYVWDASAGNQTSQSATGLGAGSFSVTITDGNGCTASQSVTLSSTGNLTTTSSVNNANCGQPDGDATVNPIGASPYGYLWDSSAASQTTQTATGLMAGAYSVTVTDSQGCTSTENVTITSAGNMSVSGTSTATSCASSCDGTGTVNASGGNTPYTFVWDNNNSTQTASGLCTGSYSVTVTDANQCMDVTSVTVNSGGGTMSLTTSSINSTCNDPNGTATINVSSGNSPYSYTWDGAASGQTVSSVSGLSSGAYNVTVTDNIGCTENTQVTVSNTGSLNAGINPSSQNICEGDNAFISASGGGTYSWSSGGSSNQISVTPTSTQTYSVTVTDATGNCTDVMSSIVTVNSAPGVPTISANPNTQICAGEPVILTASASGATSYFWSPTGDSVSTITVNPTLGNNFFSVMAYNNGCPGDPTSITIDVDPVSPTAVANATPTTTYLSQGGGVSFDASGSQGTAYEWDFLGNGVFQDFTGTMGQASYNYSAQGTFDATLCVTLNNCTMCDVVTITVYNTVGISQQYGTQDFTVYPNPVSGLLTIELPGELNSSKAQIQLYNSIGQNVSDIQFNKIAAGTMSVDLSNLPSGVYHLSLQGNGFSEVKRIQVIK